MRWKIILRIEMHGAETRRGSSARSSKSLRDKAIRPLLERLGLKQTAAESWCSDEVSLEAAAKTLPELMRILAEPRTIQNTSGELGHLFLYIERI